MLRSAIAFLSYCFISIFNPAYGEEGKDKLTLCYEDQDYAPYLLGDSDKPAMPNPGVLVEIATLAFEHAGFQVEYIRRPWKRCMRMIKENKAVGLFGTIYIPEREKIGRYPKKDGQIDASRRMINVDYPLFHSHDTSAKHGWDGKTFANKQIKIGTPLGYATVKALKEEQGIEANVSYLPDDGLKLVAEGRMDAYIVEKNVGMSILKKLGIQNKVHAHSPPFKHHELYLMLSHGFYDKYPTEAEKVWSHLATLRKTVLDDMMKSYLQR